MIYASPRPDNPFPEGFASPPQIRDVNRKIYGVVKDTFDIDKEENDRPKRTFRFNLPSFSSAFLIWVSRIQVPPLGTIEQFKPAPIDPTIWEALNNSAYVFLLERIRAPETLLDSHTGYVDNVKNGIAYVTFIDPAGRRSFAELDADDLASSGIVDGDQFIFEIKRRGNETVLTMNKIPPQQRTDGELKQIQEKIAAKLPRSILRSDEL